MAVCARNLDRRAETGTLARMDRIAIREAVKAEASLVHAEELWDTINSFSRSWISLRSTDLAEETSSSTTTRILLVESTIFPQTITIRQ